MPSNLTLREFIERHEIENMDAFWFCEGVFEGDYAKWCCVVLAREPKGRRVAEEFNAESPSELAAVLEEAGVEPPAVAEIDRLCRSAPRNPSLPRRRRGAR